MASTSLRCSLKFHKWRWASTDDGGRFRQCRRCGKDASVIGNGPLDGSAPIGLHPSGIM